MMLRLQNYINGILKQYHAEEAKGMNMLLNKNQEMLDICYI